MLFSPQYRHHLEDVRDWEGYLAVIHMGPDRKLVKIEHIRNIEGRQKACEN